MYRNLHTCFSNLHVVLMDEGHHLTRPHPFYSDQLRTLGDLPTLHIVQWLLSMSSLRRHCVGIRCIVGIIFYDRWLSIDFLYLHGYVEEWRKTTLSGWRSSYRCPDGVTITIIIIIIIIIIPMSHEWRWYPAVLRWYCLNHFALSHDHSNRVVGLHGVLPRTVLSTWRQSK